MTLEDLKKTGPWILRGVVALVILVLVLGYAWTTSGFQKQILALQNELASKDKTIETQKGLFEKLGQNIKDLQGVIDTSTPQGKELAEEVKKDRAQIAQLTNVVLQLKDQVARGQGKVDQPTVIHDGTPDHPNDIPVQPGETRVSFDQQFGVYNVNGWTLAPSGKYELHLNQTQPLKLVVALARDKDGALHSYVTSSDDGVKADIGVSGLDESLFQPKWYERIKLDMDLGAGDGVLVGVGATYKVAHFDVGPKIWGTTLSGGKVFYGLHLAWAPFERDR